MHRIDDVESSILTDDLPHDQTVWMSHFDAVQRPPEGFVATASSDGAPCAVIEAPDRKIWGVQYHPELSAREVAVAMRRQVDEIVEQGLARDEGDIEAVAALIDVLESDPGRSDIAWRLGLDEQWTDIALRRTEIRNFIDHLVQPTRTRRGRAKEGTPRPC